jgi:hypothetical protein
MYMGFNIFICIIPCVVISRIYGVRGKGREKKNRGQKK